MSERTVCVIQARQGSSRLPGKSLRALAGRPMIAHVIERARAIAGVDAVIVATSNHMRDDALAETAVRLGVPVFRGSEEDVLTRVHLAAASEGGRHVLRVTGDCPLLCPRVATEVLQLYRRVNAAHMPSPGQTYVWNDTARSGWPDGTDVEVVAFGLLTRAVVEATLPSDREHVTAWVRRHYPTACILPPPEDWSRYKLSVDRAEDYDRARAIYDALPPGDLTLAATLAAGRRAGVL